MWNATAAVLVEALRYRIEKALLRLIEQRFFNLALTRIRTFSQALAFKTPSRETGAVS